MEIVINGTGHYIPNKWEQVPLSSYMRFMSTYNEEDSELDKTIKLVSAFTNVPIVTLNKAKKSIIDKAAERLTELMSIKPTDELILQLEIDGVDYGFHPNLSELRLKEFVDLDNKLSDTWVNMHSVMSILYRPITEHKNGKYNIEEYDFVSANKRADIFKEKMSMNVASGAASFFLTIAVSYMSTMQAYSKVANRKNRRSFTKLMKKRLKNVMAGIRSSIV